MSSAQVVGTMLLGLGRVSEGVPGVAQEQGSVAWSAIRIRVASELDAFKTGAKALLLMLDALRFSSQLGHHVGDLLDLGDHIVCIAVDSDVARMDEYSRHTYGLGWQYVL